MKFEVAKREDIPGILELYNQYFENNISPYDISHMEEENKAWDNIENNNIKYFLAKDDQKIIGSCFICIIPCLIFKGKSIGFIEHVIVDENYRRKGVGTTLMEMAIKYSKENNCYKIILQSGKKRTEGHKLYEKMGFDGESKKAYEIRL